MATGGYFISFISLCMKGLLKHLKCSSEKITILSYGTLELLNVRHVSKLLAFSHRIAGKISQVLWKLGSIFGYVILFWPVPKSGEIMIPWAIRIKKITYQYTMLAMAIKFSCTYQVKLYMLDCNSLRFNRVRALFLAQKSSLLSYFNDFAVKASY